MLHGNPLLHGWYFSDVSFYTTELPEYALVELVRGLHPDVVQVADALTFTLLVVLAALVARGRTGGRDGWIRAAIPVVVTLGPVAGTYVLYEPDHTGTAVPVLLAFLLIDWFPGRRWVPVAVAAVLGWALVGDALILLIGIAPVVAVCGARSFELLALRGKQPRAVWFELSLTAAGLAATAGGDVLARLLTAPGGFVVYRQASKFIESSGQIPANVAEATADFLGLFSGDFFGAAINSRLLLIVVHAVFACAVAVAILVGLRRFFRVEDLVTRLLVTAIVINLLAYLLLYPDKTITSREIAPVFALGAALAGRVLGEEVIRRRLTALLAVAAVAAVAVTGWALVTVRPLPPVSANLASFLEQHDLRSGLAGYWQSNSTTVDSGGQVTLRSVRAVDNRLVNFRWEVSGQQYDSKTNDANFVVALRPDVTVAEATATFGKPYRTYRYGGYVIMVYRWNLLTALKPGPTPH